MSELDRDFVIDQLERAVSKTSMKRHDIEIVCPFHPDTNPSCSVHLSGHKGPIGTFHCWSCGAKGRWGRLADKLGLDHGEYHHPENPFGSRLRAIERKEKAEMELRRDQYRNHMPLGCSPWEFGDWRGLSEEFLIKLEAQRYYDDRSGCFRIVFPVKKVISGGGVIIGSAARRLDDGTTYPWLNSPGPWARKALFPSVALPKGVKTVAIVEGPYDALRLTHCGIPALSIMGTQNWDHGKMSILVGLGVKNVVICMDGDAAGRGAETKIYEATKNKFSRKRFRLPFEKPSVDPGNMSEERVEALREFGKF
jgi:DNA primase